MNAPLTLEGTIVHVQHATTGVASGGVANLPTLGFGVLANGDDVAGVIGSKGASVLQSETEVLPVGAGLRCEPGVYMAGSTLTD